jgi:hypothetical protein
MEFISFDVCFNLYHLKLLDSTNLRYRQEQIVNWVPNIATCLTRLFNGMFVRHWSDFSYDQMNGQNLLYKKNLHFCHYNKL